MRGKSRLRSMPLRQGQPPDNDFVEGFLIMHAIPRLLHTVWAVFLSVVLVACGGGELLLAALLPGVGTGGTGMVLGTLTGLGSVVVDGVRYDSSQARIETQADLSTSQTLVGSDLAVGQQVSVELDAQGAATRVEVWSQLAGPVQQLDVAASRVVVWGQTVEIVGETNNVSGGVATVISGYARWQDLQVTDLVRVYGRRTVDANGSTTLLRATRIEKVTALQDGLARATGVLQGDAATGWRMGGLVLDLNTAQVLPQGAQAQAGDWVTVTGAWDATTRASVGQGWLVQRLRLWRAAPPEGQVLQVQGVWRAASSTVVTAQGLEVDVSGTGVLERLRALPDGAVVQVQGVLNRNAGTLVVATVQAPTVAHPEAELRGSITSWVSSASFVVRGMPVDASQATWVGDTNTALLGNGSYAEVMGAVQGGIVRATQVRVAAWPEKAVLDVTGTVVAMDTATGQFTVKLGDKTIAVTPPEGRLPVLGDTVQVQGHWLNGQLRADQVLGREAQAPDLIEMAGVVGAVDQGRFLLNGQSIWLDELEDGPMAKAWLNQLKAGLRVQIRVKVVAGRYLMLGVIPKR
ncbi:MAG: putative exported protein [Pseudomonadota bacterium]